MSYCRRTIKLFLTPKENSRTKKKQYLKLKINWIGLTAD